MPSRRPWSLLPPPPRTDRWWFALSTALHVFVAVWLIVAVERTLETEQRVIMIPLDSIGGAPIVFPTTTPRRIAAAPSPERAPARPQAGAQVGGRDTATLVTPLVPAPVAVLPTPRDTAPKAPAVPAAPPRRAVARGRVDSAATTVGTHRRLGPGLGDGKLWAEARRLSRDMARAGAAGVTRAEGMAAPMDSAQRRAAMDSVVKERLRVFLANLPPDSMAAPKPQSWTDTIAGKPWGIDGSWIYLGDLKIPTAILALLPFPSGNYDQAQQAKSLQYMRDDILQAAQRAQNESDFRRYLKEERARHDAERAAERARATPPAKDTVIKN